MALPSYIVDGEGTRRRVGVTENHALKVAILPARAADQSVDELTARKLYRGFLRSGGSKDMNVNGATTPVEFRLDTSPGLVRYVYSARMLLNGAKLEIDTNDARRFGLATAVGTPLTNGVQFFIGQGGIETQIFADPVTRLIEFLNYADDFTSLKNSISSQSDFISFDFEFEEPVVLVQGVTDSIAVRIRDNLTPLELFQCIISGVQEIL